ncbi:MAG: hypothetical protein JW940_27395 [Polyangiaceae bacterium]|nr:hypothetical protein [Polyangiaceae bacterium]
MARRRQPFWSVVSTLGPRKRALVPSGVVILCLLALLGCNTSCGQDDQEPILYSDGITETTASGRVFMTSPWDGTWLHFPSHRRFLLEHRLGTRSYAPHAYLSFAEHPGAKDGGKFSEAAGNEVVFESLDEDALQVKNDTCSDFYLLVRIEADAPSGAEAGGAS